MKCNKRNKCAWHQCCILAAALFLLAAALAPATALADWDGGHDVIGCRQASKTWYFAEGTTRQGFNQWVCLMNPGHQATLATLTYMLGTGENLTKEYTLPATSRTTVNVNADVPPDSDVSLKVTADDPVLAERPMYFNFGGRWTGGHDVFGAMSTGTKWYFAEGTCRPGFNPYFCIQNPGALPADVTITYMLGDGITRVQQVAVGAHSRATIAAAGFLGEGDDPAHDFSATVESVNGVGIVAERPMYFNYANAWSGGHDVMGATAPARAFYFAEGTCRSDFEPYFCVQNPGASKADVRITYMLGDGGTREQELEVGAHSRATVRVSAFLGRGDDPSHDFSAKVESLNAAPILVERPMYFAFRSTRTGGSDVIGAAAPGRTFYFAEGTCRPGFDPFICVQNPGTATSNVKITYMLGDGTERVQETPVAAHSRSTVMVNQFLGDANAVTSDFAAKLTVTSGPSIVAERPMYFAYQPVGQWSLTAIGDVNLGGDMVPILQANGFGYVWTGVSDLIRSTTLTFANLECAISNGGEPVAGKTFTFRGPPEGLPPMRDAGVDVVSHANNHARDYGGGALMDTLGNLDSNGIAHCGSGGDGGAAHSPAIVQAGNLRVAFLAYDDIGYDGWPAGPGYPGVASATDSGWISADIASARRNADVVVVSFHWGTERKYTPDQRQVDLAHLAVDSGADLILGHHPHVAQGFEIYKGKLVAYSLGNFVFSPGSAEGHYTILTQLQMDAHGFVAAKIYPVYIDSGRPYVMSGAEADSRLSQVAALSNALGTPMTVSGGVATIP